MGKGDVKNQETDDRVKHKEKRDEGQGGKQDRNNGQDSNRNR